MGVLVNVIQVRNAFEHGSIACRVVPRKNPGITLFFPFAGTGRSVNFIGIGANDIIPIQYSSAPTIPSRASR